jgi:hypothetical protein
MLSVKTESIKHYDVSGTASETQTFQATTVITKTKLHFLDS